ncbi:hypothetical protein SBV1_2030021 [Verrucomicrobia bacterium]|nr:hypothetical protein SBV1_2030021 [Verrucomicrobiota bacterium]
MEGTLPNSPQRRATPISNNIIAAIITGRLLYFIVRISSTYSPVTLVIAAFLYNDIIDL